MIPTLRTLTLADLPVALALIDGYVATERFVAERSEAHDAVAITLRREVLATPYVKLYDPLDRETLTHYLAVPAHGYSVAAFLGAACVGFALAEPRAWNGSLWLHEFHVAAEHRRHGVGRRLMNTVFDSAREAGLRCVACETQTTNVPAIDFYSRMGFRVDGIDVAFYTNDDLSGGEVAVFMRAPVGDRPSMAPRT